MKLKYLLILLTFILIILFIYKQWGTENTTNKCNLKKYHMTKIVGEDTVAKNFLYHEETVDEDGKRNGNAIDYFLDGSYLIATYVNDTLTGYIKKYYPNGILAYLTYYKNNLKDGEEFLYDTVGRITDYMYNVLGSRCYFVHYDTNGLIDMVKGSPYCKLYSNCLEGLNIDSTFYHGMLMATPPLYSYQMLATLLDSCGKAIQEAETLEMKNNEYSYYHKFKTPGKKYWGSEYTIFSLFNKDSTIKDTYGISFKVYGKDSLINTY